jgi:hypothetical protein
MWLLGKADKRSYKLFCHSDSQQNAGTSYVMLFVRVGIAYCVWFTCPGGLFQFGRTPLQVAAMSSNCATVDALLEAGADARAQDWVRTTLSPLRSSNRRPSVPNVVDTTLCVMRWGFSLGTRSRLTLKRQPKLKRKKRFSPHYSASIIQQSHTNRHKHQSQRRVSLSHLRNQPPCCK